MFFKKEKTYIVDAATLLDGRFLVLFRTGILAGKVLVPASALKYEDTRRSKKVQDNFRELSSIKEVKIESVKQLELDEEILAVAKKRNAKVFTTREEFQRLSPDYVISVDDLYESLRPAYTAGEETTVRIVKKGKGLTEGIGYLKDGTMVVVEDGAEFQGMTIEITITGMTETTVGRLVFAKPKYR
jgi:uncharacterized protein YacL